MRPRVAPANVAVGVVVVVVELWCGAVRGLCGGAVQPRGVGRRSARLPGQCGSLGECWDSHSIEVLEVSQVVARVDISSTPCMG